MLRHLVISVDSPGFCTQVSGIGSQGAAFARRLIPGSSNPSSLRPMIAASDSSVPPVSAAPRAAPVIPIALVPRPSRRPAPKPGRATDRNLRTCCRPSVSSLVRLSHCLLSASAFKPKRLPTVVVASTKKSAIALAGRLMFLATSVAAKLTSSPRVAPGLPLPYIKPEVYLDLNSGLI